MTDDLQILLHDECQLMDWGESRAAGPWVKLRLADVSQLEVFRGMDTATAKKSGHILNVTISQGDILPNAPSDDGDTSSDAPHDPEADREWGAHAKALRLSAFFRNPDVWHAIGSPDDYRAWIHKQPCIVCRDGDWVDGERLCEAAHVRRAGESGTSYKADYAEVPMCHEHHSLTQHQHGETRAYRVHQILRTGHERLVDIEEARDWFNRERIRHVVAWCWGTLRTTLGYGSWAEVPPAALMQWAVANGLEDSGLPDCYFPKPSGEI